MTPKQFREWCDAIVDTGIPVVIMLIGVAFFLAAAIAVLRRAI